MKLRDVLPLGAQDASHSAMRWLQAFADAWSYNVLQLGDSLAECQSEEVVCELHQFIESELPRLHMSFGTDPKCDAVFHQDFLAQVASRARFR